MVDGCGVIKAKEERPSVDAEIEARDMSASRRG